MLFPEYEFILKSMKIGERGQVTIPKPLRERFGLTADVEVDIIVKGGMLVVEPKRDRAKFRKGLEEWRGQSSKRMRAMGFASTNEYIEALRGR